MFVLVSTLITSPLFNNVNIVGLDAQDTWIIKWTKYNYNICLSIIESPFLY